MGLIPGAAEKPELVPNDATASGAGEVRDFVQGRLFLMPAALRVSLKVEIRLYSRARPVRHGRAVKLVAAGLDHGIDQQAAPRHLGVAAHGLHARPVDCVEVHVAALVAPVAVGADDSTPSSICHGEPSPGRRTLKLHRVAHTRTSPRPDSCARRAPGSRRRGTHPEKKGKRPPAPS